ncbi:MAG: DUF4332 domain-containing protein [Cyanobacteria bacterium P01_A01_bin.123]
MQDWPLEQLPGLSLAQKTQLKDFGIQTTLQLLRRGSTALKRQQLATDLQIHTQYVNKWVALADLARVPEVGCQYCGLLLHAGVSSTQQLAQASAHRLYPQIRRFQVAVLRQAQNCPPPSQVSRWIQQARSLNGV